MWPGIAKEDCRSFGCIKNVQIYEEQTHMVWLMRFIVLRQVGYKL